MHVVLGANGRAGGETARALIESGDAVRVVLRRREQAESWTRLGADVAMGDIEDVPSIVAALEDAAGAFLLCPPPVSGDPYRRAEEVGGALAEAARQARLPKAVVLSSIGAQHRTGTGVIAMLNILERHLEAAAPTIAFLRPGYFVETWGEVARAVIAEGVLPSFLEPSRKIPMVSTIDVGRAAATLLRDEFSGRRIVELRGPRDWSANDVAAAFARLLDRAVEMAFVPAEARADILAGEGVPREVADSLLGMYQGLANGRVAHQEGNEQRRGSVELSEALERIVRTMGAGTGGLAA